MRSYQSTILYLFIFLIVITGVGLFIFKDTIVDQMLNYNINGPVTSVVNNNSNNAQISLDILRDARIKELKNYVNVFDYNDLEKSQTAILANFANQGDVIISNPDGATSTATTTKTLIRVRVGNSNPFIKQAVK